MSTIHGSFKFGGFIDEVLNFRVDIDKMWHNLIHDIVCTHIDTDDEYFCDNINRTLPSSLVQDLPAPNVIINPSQEPFGGASPLSSLLILPALTAITLLGTLLVLH